MGAGVISAGMIGFGDVEYSIAITIGMGKNDYRFQPDAILEKANRKLSMGEVHGRDQVVK
jgi:hypothetical protein